MTRRKVAGEQSASTPPAGEDRPVSPLASERRQPKPPFSRIADDLRKCKLVDDRVFDDVYPLSIQSVSSVYWTPVEVAVRASELLASRPGAVILDVGAGVAKFCIVAAASVDAVVEGVEHRAHLVDVGREAAANVGVRVQLSHGTLADVDPARVDGIYLFNPFAENLYGTADHLDETVELSEARFRHDIAETERFLRAARAGTRLVTYCGWGGVPPDDYQLRSREQRGATLELWIKTPGYSRERDSNQQPTPLWGGPNLRALRE